MLMFVETNLIFNEAFLFYFQVFTLFKNKWQFNNIYILKAIGK